MDEFDSNAEAPKGPEAFAAQAGFACAAPGRSHSRRMARPMNRFQFGFFELESTKWAREGYTFPMKPLQEQPVEVLTPWQKQGVLAALSDMEDGAPTLGHKETMTHLRSLLEKTESKAKVAKG